MFVFAPPPPCWIRKPDALRAQLFIPWPCGGNALVSQTLERFVCVCRRPDKDTCFIIIIVVRRKVQAAATDVRLERTQCIQLLCLWRM